MEMTQEWIQKFNDKCYAFVGLSITWFRSSNPLDPEEFDLDISVPECMKELAEGIDKRFFDWLYEECELPHESLKFHSDWNWIMVVVEKIASSHDNDILGLNTKIFKFRHMMFHEIIGQKDNLIQAIDQFIDWYNEQKK